MILIYDGACGFCSSSAAWIRSRVPGDVRVEPWQELDLGEFGLTEHQAAAAAWWIDDHGNRSAGHTAIGKALVAAGGAWGRLGRLSARRPWRWAARPIYRLIARHRLRLGGTASCRTR